MSISDFRGCFYGAISVSLNGKKIEIGYIFICKTDFYPIFYKIQNTLLSHKSSKIKGFYGAISVSLNGKKIEIGYIFICKTDFYPIFYKIQNTLLSHKSSKIKGF